MKTFAYNDRDLSWLSFNELVLQKAACQELPLLERLKFISIFSSNLDEFYRVRMPVLMALSKIPAEDIKKYNPIVDEQTLKKVQQAILKQQMLCGSILKGDILPQLKEKKIEFVCGKTIPEGITEQTARYFYSRVLAFLRPVYLSASDPDFFPESNRVYLLATLEAAKGEQIAIINIPSIELPRFFKAETGGITYLLFLEDIIKMHLGSILPAEKITGIYSFKITRDATLDLSDEYGGSLAEQIEKKLLKRDMGLATRVLIEGGTPKNTIERFCDHLNLQHALITEGGTHHNLRDLFSLPLTFAELSQQRWAELHAIKHANEESVLDRLRATDIIIHTPYHTYDPVLRFFNEAATDTAVREISVTLYRIAPASSIVNALMTAAKNGKKVMVMIELKARFDEDNNLKWAKKMELAGIQIAYSPKNIKVHAKVALVKRVTDKRTVYSALLSTGNFNENSACFYTDHILMTSRKEITSELRLLFGYLSKGGTAKTNGVKFKNLLVSRFNLQQKLLKLIDREISYAKAGLPAEITIKLNNLEERRLIARLYKASNAGVRINLLVRSVCTLVPGIPGQSVNITVKRIVGRYLEHGRIFIFHNNGSEQVFMGSADWMNRNIYHRIEVCFPILQEDHKQQVMDLVRLQLNDTVEGFFLNRGLENQSCDQSAGQSSSQSQVQLYLENLTAHT